MTIDAFTACLGFCIFTLVVTRASADCAGLTKRSIDDPVVCHEFGPVCVDNTAYMVYTRKASWLDAEQNCSSLGGTLYVMNSTKVDKMVRKFIISEYLDDLIVVTGYWTGLNDIDEEGVYRWPDGSVLESEDYSRWARNQPNNRKNSQDCVQIWKDAGYKWDDATCTKRKPYVCEYQNLGGPDGCSLYSS
ncbi:C-type lectin BfL-2-like [Saccoglossus kowalevskii]|uniref:C-type lectin BfL-2-like n=1 Tax=Saccoglossus kowalevskii TaxID=10224 RepID=A0ABM0N0R5_SACKO|nr:PREDICTED: C-type lectin BfL-2-like [Saccoglossus kowalevskii]